MAVKRKAIQQFVAIVDAQVGSDHRSAGAPAWLMVVPIFWSHSHHGVNKPDVLLSDEPVFVRSILMKGVRHTLKLPARDASSIQTNYAGYAAHRRNTCTVLGTPNSAMRVNRLPPVSPMIVWSSTSIQACPANSCCSRATARQGLLAIPRRRNIACAASA